METILLISATVIFGIPFIMMIGVGVFNVFSSASTADYEL